MKVLSFHSCIEADQNICCACRALNKEDESAIRDADAVILPQGCKENLYLLARKNCAYVFPNYDAFFQHPGKAGQIELFAKHNVTCPQTIIYKDIASYDKIGMLSSFAKSFVFKLSWGGEGKNVFLINSLEDLEDALRLAAAWERRGKKGFLLQEYIATGGRSLRVVVIGDHFIPYWRIGRNANDFYSNIAKGAIIDHNSFPEQQKAAIQALRKFCLRTGINLAGFDFLFADEGDKKNLPLFLEINYFFRTKGLGGHDNYIKLLEQSIKAWLATIKLAIS